MPDGADILDAKILNKSREVTGFKIAIPSGTGNILDIAFDILERDDGGSIQLIYAGDHDATIAFKGTVVGAKSIKVHNAYATENDMPFIEQMKLHWKESLGMIFGIILLSIFVILLQRKPEILSGIINKLPVGETIHQLIIYTVLLLLSGLVPSLILVSLNQSYQALADVPSILIGKN
ncbi:MAG: hypothetical protein ACR2KT_18275 [Methylocella sp.]